MLLPDCVIQRPARIDIFTSCGLFSNDNFLSEVIAVFNWKDFHPQLNSQFLFLALLCLVAFSKSRIFFIYLFHLLSVFFHWMRVFCFVHWSIPVPGIVLGTYEMFTYLLNPINGQRGEHIFAWFTRKLKIKYSVNWYNIHYSWLHLIYLFILPFDLFKNFHSCIFMCVCYT